MTSKKLKPVSSLIQQWCNQEAPHSSYRILIQSTHSLPIRIQAAETVENPHLYRRAGLRTPSETAAREIVGGNAWLHHFLEIGQKSECHVVYVCTQAPPREVPSNMTLIDLSQDPWGWDDDDHNERSNSSLRDLKSVFDLIARSLKEKKNAKVPVMLVWDTLTQLNHFHGTEVTIAFLKSFQNCLQIWPVRIETMNSQQHSIVEDAAHALLYLQDGEMTMIRQGIREKGNIVRENLPFHLSSKGNNEYLLELQEEEIVHEKFTPDVAPSRDVNDSDTATKSAHATSIPSNARPKIKLALEEDVQEEKILPSRPRIYLEDDDPEFDDLDEEDPDDDLDI